MASWLQIQRGDAPVVLSIPHTGESLLPEMERQLVSLMLARKDIDWHVEKLYSFAPSLGITIVRTLISRVVIDVNRDPSGKPLYPGQNTTELCPTTTFDGEPLYKPGCAPTVKDIATRRRSAFEPYHTALAAELARLKAQHGKVVLFDAHSIRSEIPRLFQGQLPDFNVGTNSGESCDPALTAAVEAMCDSTSFSRVTNGRFKGGWTTRHYGRPADGVHAIQLELACRAYMPEPPYVSWESWPPPFDETRASPVMETLHRVLSACVRFSSRP